MTTNKKVKDRHTGDKFLSLILMNSLMKTKNKEFLDAVEKKMLKRLSIVATKDRKTLKHILDYSNPKLKDPMAAKKFHTLLK